MNNRLEGERRGQDELRDNWNNLDEETLRFRRVVVVGVVKVTKFRFKKKKKFKSFGHGRFEISIKHPSRDNQADS